VKHEPLYLARSYTPLSALVTRWYRQDAILTESTFVWQHCPAYELGVLFSRHYAG
jgi:hypothetical protein